MKRKILIALILTVSVLISLNGCAFNIENNPEIEEEENDRGDDSDDEDDEDDEDEEPQVSAGPEIIDINLLKKMKKATYNEDKATINDIMFEICKKEYGNDDDEFINVLNAAIQKGDMIEINDLLMTYISLKS